MKKPKTRAKSNRKYSQEHDEGAFSFWRTLRGLCEANIKSPGPPEGKRNQSVKHSICVFKEGANSAFAASFGVPFYLLEWGAGGGGWFIYGV